MPSMNDAARMMAAGDGTGMDMGPAPDPGTVEAMSPNDGQDPMADMQGALDMIDGACATMPPEIQEKMREHIEAIRALTEEAGAALATQPAPEREQVPPPPPTAGAGDQGMMA
jgi:hypothetical protein